MTFDGFDVDALALLHQTPSWSREDYASNKATLKAGLYDPAIALIEDVADALSPAVGAELTVKPKIGGSLSPLNRDLRFAKDKSTLYKEALMLTTWEGTDKGGVTLWIRLTPDRIGFASGIGFDKERRERWRQAVGDDATGEELAGSLKALSKKPDYDVAGAELKNAPKPWGNDHPRADLLRHTGFQVRWQEKTPASIGSGRFADHCIDRLGALVPVHRWLSAHVAR